MKWFISLLLISFMQTEENNHPIFLKHKHVIDKATEISLYEISTNPTLPTEQDKAKSYIQDYEVLKIIALEKDQKPLQDAILEKGNYISEKKSCPMQAKYALKFIRKKHHITLIISDSACPKTVIFSSEEDINKQYHDLKNDSSIYHILHQLSK